MIIDHLRITIAKFDLFKDGSWRCMVEIQVDGKKYSSELVFPPEHFLAYFDWLWRDLGDELKKRLEASDEKST